MTTNGKVASIAEGVATIGDGAFVGVGGIMFQRKPIALCRALATHQARSLCYVSFTATLDAEILADAGCLAELHAAFGDRMGRFTAITGRAGFPLGLNATSHVVDGRVAAIGNAAQTLHPVAGQGLNLGLRDAFDLAETMVRDARHGTPGPAALMAFARRRRADRGLTIRITDLLPRVFGIDATPVALLRGMALAGLDLVPPLKTAFARQMMFGQRG